MIILFSTMSLKFCEKLQEIAIGFSMAVWRYERDVIEAQGHGMRFKFTIVSIHVKIEGHSVR